MQSNYNKTDNVINGLQPRLRWISTKKNEWTDRAFRSKSMELDTKCDLSQEQMVTGYPQSKGVSSVLHTSGIFAR